MIDSEPPGGPPSDPDTDPTREPSGSEWAWYKSFVAVLAQLRGYTVDNVPGAGDYGADWLLYADSKTPKPAWVVHCKLRQGPVGIAAVQEAYAARDYYEARKACVVSPSTFTAPAHDMAERLDVALYSLGTEVWRDGWSTLPEALMFQGPPSNRLAPVAVSMLVEQRFAQDPPWFDGREVVALRVTHVALGRVGVGWVYECRMEGQTRAAMFRGPRQINMVTYCDAVTGDVVQAAQLDPGSIWVDDGPS